MQPFPFAAAQTPRRSTRSIAIDPRLSVQNQSEVIARPEPLSIGAAPEVAPPQPPLRGGAAEEGRRRNAKRSSRKKDPRRRGDAVELWKPFAKKAAADGQ